MFNLKHEQVKRIIPCTPAPISQLPQCRAQTPALLTSNPAALSPQPGDHLEINSRKLYKVVILATHSSTLAWQIPWTEEPGGLQSMGSWRVGHDWAPSLSLFNFMHCRRQWQPTPAFLPGESQGWGSLVGCRLWGCTESDTTEATQQQQQLLVTGIITQHPFSDLIFKTTSELLLLF